MSPVGHCRDVKLLNRVRYRELTGGFLGSEGGVLIVISVKFSTVTSSVASNCVLLDILKVFIKKRG